MKPKFEIGDKVYVKGVYQACRRSEKGKRTRVYKVIDGDSYSAKKYNYISVDYKMFDLPIKAVVTGYCYLKEGVCKDSYFRTTNSILAVRVRYSYLNKELVVPESHLELAGLTDFHIPWYYDYSTTTEDFKQAMREEAQGMKRDKHGKFLPFNYIKNSVHLNAKGMYDKNKMKVSQGAANKMKKGFAGTFMEIDKKAEKSG